jgi:2-methylisocitrate lyase-like PEP mutase family enzyme
MAMERDALVQLAGRLLDLHHGPKPLVLPNAWDVGSAVVVERAGAAAVATTSSGVAASLGHADGQHIPPAEMFLVILRIAGAVRLPVTADLEGGYGLPPEAVVEELVRAGAVGLNYEDTDWADPDLALLDAAAQANRIAAMRRAATALGVPVVINARIDVFLRGEGTPRERLEPAIARATAYLAAGADCVYPIGLDDAGLIGRFVRRVDGPVNVLLRPGAPSLRQLRRLGVRRVSVGGGLWRHAMATSETVARRLLEGDGGPFAVIGES